jgi:hypothetical protein
MIKIKQYVRGKSTRGLLMETGRARSLQINLNLYSIPKIIVLKIQIGWSSRMKRVLPWKPL